LYSDNTVGATVLGGFWVYQSIDIDKTNSFQLQFSSSIKGLEATVLGGFGHVRVANLRCAQIEVF